MSANAEIRQSTPTPAKMAGDVAVSKAVPIAAGNNRQILLCFYGI